jgi:hypothetical protein
MELSLLQGDLGSEGTCSLVSEAYGVTVSKNRLQDLQYLSLQAILA